MGHVEMSKIWRLFQFEDGHTPRIAYNGYVNLPLHTTEYCEKSSTANGRSSMVASVSGISGAGSIQPRMYWTTWDGFYEQSSLFCNSAALSNGIITTAPTTTVLSGAMGRWKPYIVITNPIECDALVWYQERIRVPDVTHAKSRSTHWVCDFTLDSAAPAFIDGEWSPTDYSTGQPLTPTSIPSWGSNNACVLAALSLTGSSFTTPAVPPFIGLQVDPVTSKGAPRYAEFHVLPWEQTSAGFHVFNNEAFGVLVEAYGYRHLKGALTVGGENAVDSEGYWEPIPGAHVLFMGGPTKFIRTAQRSPYNQSNAEYPWTRSCPFSLGAYDAVCLQMVSNATDGNNHGGAGVNTGVRVVLDLYY